MDRYSNTEKFKKLITALKELKDEWIESCQEDYDIENWTRGVEIDTITEKASELEKILNQFS
jgi:hypothetical protein